jgi:hypothetical protein
MQRVIVQEAAEDGEKGELLAMFLRGLVLWGDAMYSGIGALDTMEKIDICLVNLLAQGQELHPGIMAQRRILLEMLCFDCFPHVIWLPFVPED